MQWIELLLPNFLLVFCRITAFFVTAPVFSYRGVPTQFKVGIAFFVSLLTFLSVGNMDVAVWDETYVLSIVKEILVGLILGFTAAMFFYVMQIAGAFIDMMIGFGIANIVDPMSGTQSPILGNFKFYIAVLLFLAMNGHHHLLGAIMRSYEWIPIHLEWLSHIADGSISSFLLQSFVATFTLAFQMAAPIVVSMFLVDVGLGILAKTAPQFNIFIVGIPIKIMIGFLVLMITIPGLVFLFDNLFQTMFRSLNELLNTMGR